MIFGIYCEVSIETLREVKLKYIEDYEGLVQFLCDFHLLEHKPSVLAIDSLEYFVDSRRQGINQLTKQMRFNFLMTLLKDCQQFLDTSVYKQNNLIVSYKLHNSEMKAETSEEEQMQINEVEFQRLYSELSRYTPQIYYIARNKITHLIDTHLLQEDQKEEIQ